MRTPSAQTRVSSTHSRAGSGPLPGATSSRHSRGGGSRSGAPGGHRSSASAGSQMSGSRAGSHYAPQFPMDRSDWVDESLYNGPGPARS